MEKETLEKLIQRLLQEKTRLEDELSHVAHRNPQNPEDWQPTASDLAHDIGSTNGAEPDPSDMANRIEDLEEHVETGIFLEDRLNQVKSALGRADDGSYGICRVGGVSHTIEEMRLDANPAADTCIKHKNSEK